MTILDGKIALVIGGAGEVGEGVVRQFLNHGATVVVPSRSQYRLDDLLARFSDVERSQLVTFQAGCGTEEGAADLREFIQAEVGPLDCVVASIGGWWQGSPLSEVPLRLWSQLLDNSLNAHFIAAKTFLPVLAQREGSSYTMLNGGAALRAVANAGPISVSAAAQLMLKDVLAAEYEDLPVRINTLLIVTPVATRSREVIKDHWITADEVGRYTVYLASAAAEMHGETVLFREHDDLPAFRA